MTDRASARLRRQGEVSGYSWYGLGVLTLVYMINFVDRQILSILANDIKHDLLLSDAELGFLYGTAFAVFYAVFGIPLGRVADCWSRTRLLSIGLALWSCMTVLSGFARSGTGLSFARIGVGVGEASANPCAYSLLADWFPQSMRATALAIYSAGLFVGSGLSLVLGALVVDHWNAAYPGGGPGGLVGWQAAFLVAGLPGLILAGWVFSVREPNREGAGPPTGQNWHSAMRVFVAEAAQVIPPFTLVGAARRGPKDLARNLFAATAIAAVAVMLTMLLANGQQFLTLGIAIYAVFSWASSLRASDRATFECTWQSPAFVAIVGAYGAVCFVGYTVTYWAAPYAERTLGMSKSDLGLLLGIPASICGLVGVIAGGVLADALHRRSARGRLLVIAGALLGSAPLVLLAYQTADRATFLVCSALLQFITSSALGASAAASQSLVTPQMRGTASAIFLLGATLIGLACGPFVAGLVSESTGGLGTGVIATLAIVPLGLLSLLVAWRSAPEYARDGR